MALRSNDFTAYCNFGLDVKCSQWQTLEILHKLCGSFDCWSIYRSRIWHCEYTVPDYTHTLFTSKCIAGKFVTLRSQTWLLLVKNTVYHVYRAMADAQGLIRPRIHVIKDCTSTDSIGISPDLLSTWGLHDIIYHMYELISLDMLPVWCHFE